MTRAIEKVCFCQERTLFEKAYFFSFFFHGYLIFSWKKYVFCGFFLATKLKAYSGHTATLLDSYSGHTAMST